MKLLINFISVFVLVISQQVFAEEHPFVPFGVRALSIKLSNDRTGIIKGVGCVDCDFTTVKITPKTRAYRNRVEVDLLEAKMRAGKSALVSFNPKTREVQTIRWKEE